MSALSWRRVDQARQGRADTVAPGRRMAEGFLAAVLFLGAWELATEVIFPGRHVVPPPTAVALSLVRAEGFPEDLRTTLWEAFRGFLIGNGAALVLAVVALFVPRVRRLFQQFGAITYCVPTVAVGPLLLVFVSPDTTKVLMAALSVFFVSLIAWMTGLAAVDQSALELVRGFGGSRMDELVRVRLRSALPAASSGLALSAPAAVLGAIIGEYLGGNSGLGVAMVSAEQQFQVARTWALGLEATVVSGLAYGLVRWVAERLAGAPPVGTLVGSGPGERADERGARRFAQVAGPWVTVGVLVAGWAAVIEILGLPTYFAKTPFQVWSYLVTGPTAAAHRSVVLGALLVTLKDSAGGWALGTVGALLGAVAVAAVGWLRSVVYPVVMVLRSVPLIAMVPLITLVFGQRTTGVVVIAAIVSFVPTLVLVVSGLEAAPPLALELARAHAASRWTTLLRIQSRYAMPNIFAAAKVAMPGSVLGAVLAEWLITGNGVGHLMAADLIGSNFSSLWAAVVSVSAVSLLLYELVGALERATAQRVAG